MNKAILADILKCKFFPAQKGKKTDVKDQLDSHIIADNLLTIGSQRFACETWDNEMQTENGCSVLQVLVVWNICLF